MPRTTSIIHKPSLGCKYVFENTKTKIKEVGKVLGPADKKKYGDIKSGRKCERGKEFFKVLINDKVFKMMNSNMNKECTSEDGVWLFTGVKPFKNKSDKKKKMVKVKNKPVVERNKIEFISEAAMQKIKEQK
jgi:hypothetical protein